MTEKGCLQLSRKLSAGGEERGKKGLMASSTWHVSPVRRTRVDGMRTHNSLFNYQLLHAMRAWKLTKRSLKKGNAQRFSDGGDRPNCWLRNP